MDKKHRLGYNPQLIPYRSLLIKAQLHKKHNITLKQKTSGFIFKDKTLVHQIRLDGNTIKDINENDWGAYKTNFKPIYQHLAKKDRIHKWQGTPSLSLIIGAGDQDSFKDLARFLLKGLKNCSNLNLFFTRFADNGKSKEFNDFIFTICQHLRHIKHFHLTFKAPGVLSQLTLQSIFKRLLNRSYNQNRLTLTSACETVNIDPSLILQKTKRVLSQALSCSNSINFSIIKAASQVGLKAFKTPQKTIDFSFDISYLNMVTDSQFYNMAKALVQGAPFPLPLSNLNLSLKCLWKVTDKSFTVLIHCLKKLAPTLKHLKIDCYGWRTLTDQALEYLRKEIYNFHALKYLDLNFGDCQALTDQGVMPLLCQICRNLDGLQTLILNFSKLSQYTKKITDYSMINFAREIQNMKSLKILVLNFNEIPNITSKGLETLVQKINECLELETLVLSCEWCKGVSHEEKYHLRQIIVKVPNVQIL